MADRKHVKFEADYLRKSLAVFYLVFLVLLGCGFDGENRDSSRIDRKSSKVLDDQIVDFGYRIDQIPANVICLPRNNLPLDATIPQGQWLVFLLQTYSATHYAVAIDLKSSLRELSDEIKFAVRECDDFEELENIAPEIKETSNIYGINWLLYKDGDLIGYSRSFRMEQEQIDKIIETFNAGIRVRPIEIR